MKKLKKILKWLGVLLVLLLVGTPVSMRLMRHKASAPETIGGGIVHVRNFFTDIYGVRAGDRVLLFDGGVDERGDALDVLLGALGVTRDQVTDVFLTHGHFDHIAFSPLCKKARIHLGVADADMAAQKVPITPWRGRLISLPFSVPPVTLTDALVDRAEIDIGGEKLVAIPTPGHTAGSYLFVWKGVMIAGDTIVRDGDHLEVAMPGFAQNPAQNRQSLAKLKELLGTVKVEQVCTGHQACTAPGAAAAQLDDLVKRASGS